jgi:heavy metal translocating P-type ATPase
MKVTGEMETKDREQKRQTGASCCATHEHHAPEHEHGLELREVLRVVFVALAAAAVWFHLWEPFPGASVIGLAGALVGGYPIVKEAIENIFERRMTMELSMTIALIAALAIGEFFTALVITGFVLAAEILEGLTVGRGRRAIEDMLDFLPQTASVLRDGQIVEVPTQTILPGEIVLIRPGSRIPVDGQVVSGQSFVEEAAITGEPMPREKAAGSEVFAGTINQAGSLQVRADRLGSETAFGKIIEAVERAEHSRAPIQKTADRLAGYLVYFALGAAVLTFLVTHNIRSTISVIIVAGACGIAAGTPLAILGAIGRAARLGSIIKGGIYLEALGRIDTVFLDKTGTITYGEPALAQVRPERGVSERELLQAAASAEHGSEHPLGRAIVRYAEQKNFSLSESSDFRYQVGRGIVAQVQGERVAVGNRAHLLSLGVELPARVPAFHGTSVFVANGSRYFGCLSIEDEVRPGAAVAVKELEAMKIRVILLTGDTQAAAEEVAAQMGIIHFHADLLPEQKAVEVASHTQRGRIVAMLGDGINDAPALMNATVGVAMGSGTDVARESADVVLIGNDLEKFVETVRIARRCRAIIFQNFYGTLIVDSIGIGLAAAGFLNPLLAAFIHVASELTFILNSTRLLPPRVKENGPNPLAVSAALRRRTVESSNENEMAQNLKR